jgi:hypothetical protein
LLGAAEQKLGITETEAGKAAEAMSAAKADPAKSKAGSDADKKTTAAERALSEVIRELFTLFGEGAKGDVKLEAWAKQLESSFGKAAMGNGTAKAAAKEGCNRMIEMVTTWRSTVVKKEQEVVNIVQDPSFRQLVTDWFGTPAKATGVAGAIGQDPDVILKHMAGENIRTQMTALFNFHAAFPSALLNTAEADAQSFLEKLKGDKDKLMERYREAKPKYDSAKKKAEEKGERAPRASLLEKAPVKAVAGQEEARLEIPLPSRDSSSRTGQDVGLTQDETAFQKLDSIETDRVKWEEGGLRWIADERNEWIKAARQANLPITAAPSGTTDRLMQTRAQLGVSDPISWRAAIIAYLLPINAHSLIEVLTAAGGYSPCQAPAMNLSVYKEIQPFGSLESYSPDPAFWKAVQEGKSAKAGEEKK